MSDGTPDKNVEEALDNINKKYGTNSIMRMDGDTALNIEAFSTKCLSLDRVLGCGGIPKGRVIEIFGQESSGKSTLSLFIAAQVQKQGGKCVWIDTEQSYTTDYAQQVGVDTSQLIVSQPTTGEEALDIVNTMAKSQGIDLIVLDSVASLVPQKELEGEIVDSTIALQARMMSKALRVLTGTLGKSKTTVIFINQVRDKIGVFFGNKTTTSGGRALKFYSSIRLEVRKMKTLKKGDEAYGTIMGVTAVKNKVAPPFRKCEIELLFGEGVDLVGDVLDVAIEKGIVVKEGNTYKFKDEKLAVGRDHTKRYLKENPDIFDTISADLIMLDIKE